MADSLDHKLGRSTLEAGLLMQGGYPVLKGVDVIENISVNIGGRVLSSAPNLESSLVNITNKLKYLSTEGLYYLNNPPLLAKKGIHSITDHLNITVKQMAETPVKVAVANGLAAAGVKVGFEGYNYYSGKPLTKDNLLNSGKDIVVSGGLGLSTSGMPLAGSIVTGLAIDKINTGNINLGKTLSTGLVGESLGYYYPSSPIMREAGAQLYELFYKNRIEKKDENK